MSASAACLLVTLLLVVLGVVAIAAARVFPPLVVGAVAGVLGTLAATRLVDALVAGCFGGVLMAYYYGGVDALAP